MADNVTIDNGDLTDYDVASDDVSGKHYQRVKVDLGADGASSPLVRGQQTKANSLPVVLASDQDSLTVDGSGVTQPISAASLPLPTGAATSANQSTLIGHVDGIEGLLTTIDADTGTIAGAVSGTEMQVDVVTSALPSGAATAANQSTANTALSAIQTAVETLDNAISGTEMQVDVVGSLPAGTNLIGDVTLQRSATAADGCSAYFDADADNTAQAVKASGGLLKGWYIYNPNSSAAFVQIYNVAAGSVTVGTTTPALSLGIPAESGANVAPTEPGIEFSTAIAVACTTTATGSADPTTGLVVNLFYE